MDGLTDESRKIYNGNHESAALLVADKDVTLEKVTDVVDAIKTGGVQKVAFSIQKRK